MQPPPGYPQQPQGQPYPQGPQPMPQGYGPPPGPMPQYATQQQPYYPQQKRGMPGWAWALIIVAVVLFCGIPVLALAAIPLISSNTRDARRAEGEQLMGSGRDYVRVEYSKTGQLPSTFSSMLKPHELSMFRGHYYVVDDAITSLSNDKAKITCTPMQSASDGNGSMEFKLMDGESEIRWDGVPSKASSSSSSRSSSWD